MTSPAPALLGRDRILALVGVVVVAINLRTAVGGISPIIGRISEDIALDPVALALIASAPPLIFALSGFVGPLAARMLGLEGAMLAAVLVSVVGHLLRAAAPEVVTLTLGTMVVLLGAGVGNVLLPPVVKKFFPKRIGTVSALYVTMLSIGATLPPVIAVPVADSAGWRFSLGVWSASALVAAVPWIAELAVRGRRPEPPPMTAATAAAAEPQPGLGRRLFRSPVAWSLALLFAVPSMGAYFSFAWLPTMLVQISGVDDVQAGLLLGVFAVCGFPVGILIPILAARLRSVTPIIVAGLVLFVAAYLGFLLAPAASPVLWTILIGLGPLLFPLALTLINLRSRTQAGSVALSGFVQGIGYTVSAMGPFLVGLLHDATGGWTVPLLFLLGSLVLAVPALVVLGRPRFVEDELRPGRPAQAA